MIKILHTSDWHLGHTLYNYDRSPEQQAFLRQLADIVREEQPDAMLVCGDIYHYSTPSAATQRMYTDAMLEIHRACPGMTIVVTAGNHDSNSKLEVDSNLWRHFRVQVVGHIERTEEEVNLEKHIVGIEGADGSVKGYVVAMPHVYPQNVPMLDTDTPREERLGRFVQALLDEVEKRNDGRLPVVLTAHLSISGSDRTGHDTVVGGMEFVPLQTLGTGYDYLALGHIHCPQSVPGSKGHARYCGTPLPVSFDESYPHSVSIVTVERGETPQIRTREITNPQPLVTLPRTPQPFEEALKLLADFPDEQPAYIRLNVRIKDYLAPDCNERASQAVREKACRYCCIKTTRETTESDKAEHYLSIREVQQMSPLDIARLYYRENEGEEMDEELCRLMEEAMERVGKERS